MRKPLLWTGAVDAKWLELLFFNSVSLTVWSSVNWDKVGSFCVNTSISQKSCTETKLVILRISATHTFWSSTSWMQNFHLCRGITHYLVSQCQNRRTLGSNIARVINCNVINSSYSCFCNHYFELKQQVLVLVQHCVCFSKVIHWIKEHLAKLSWNLVAFMWPSGD